MPPGAYLFFAVLERGWEKRGFIREGDLLIIQGKKCYENVLMHFFCYKETVLTASKVY